MSTPVELLTWSLSSSGRLIHLVRSKLPVAKTNCVNCNALVQPRVYVAIDPAVKGETQICWYDQCPMCKHTRVLREETYQQYKANKRLAARARRIIRVERLRNR